MAVYFNKKKKPMFHKPEKTGEVKPIPTSVPMIIISVLGLVLLAGLIVLSVIGYNSHNGGTLVLAEGFTMPSGIVFLFLPIVAAVICLGFRLALRVIPLDMWRLPKSIKEAAQKTGGKYLKMCTLLLEIETTIMFIFITLLLNQGLMPGDIPMFIWIAVIVATIIIFGKLDIAATGKVKK